MVEMELKNGSNAAEDSPTLWKETKNIDPGESRVLGMERVCIA